MTDKLELVGVAEIAEIAGVDKNVVGNWVMRKPRGFPEPYATYIAFRNNLYPLRDREVAQCHRKATLVSLSVWLKPEGDSLDPPKLNSKAKLKQLIYALHKERDWILKEIRKEVESCGSVTLMVLKQLELAIASDRDPLWGSYGPMQGIPIERVSALSGRLHEINEILGGIYLLFPELKPAEQPASKPKKPKKK